MTDRVTRLALCAGLAAGTLIGPAVGLAYADDHGRRADQGRREALHDQGGWREGYYRRPDVYYSAPPVIYPPEGYYQQPYAALNLNFPLIIR